MGVKPIAFGAKLIVFNISKHNKKRKPKVHLYRIVKNLH